MINKDFLGGSYCKIPNEILQKSNLSLESIGVLCCVLSYPSNFIISRSWVMNRFNLSDYKTRLILKELRDFGVLKTNLIRDSSGVILKTELTLDISDRLNFRLKGD